MFFRSCRSGGGGEQKISSSNKTHKSIYLPLIDYLKEGYNPLAVPVCDNKTKFHVFMDMWLYQLFDLDEPTQMLTIDVWMEMLWFDCMLTWNPESFNGLDQITLPAGEIYHPDLIWYQSLHGNFEEGMFLFPQSIARIRHNGMVQLGAQALLKSFCRVDIRRFPYDTQKCNLTFASWNQNANIFNITKKDAGDSKGHSFKNASNGEWEVIEFPAFNTLSSYKLGSDESTNGSFYAEVTFQLTLQRKPKFIKIYLIFPCILLVWIAALTFVLPIESGEKVSLSVTILLSVIVFLLLVSENIPRTSDGIPILGLFFCLSIGLVCLSVLMTAIVLHVGEKPKELKMPKCLRRLLNRRFLCLHPANAKGKDKTNSSIKRRQNNKNDMDDDDDDHDDRCEKLTYWRCLAALLDRVFLFIYLFFAILVTIYIYVQEPATRSFSGHESGH